MPELPEVETVVCQLAPLVRGRVIEAVRVDDPRWCAPLAPARFEAALVGARIEALSRRGKYLIWEFADGSRMLQHLRMSGVILCDPLEEPRHRRATILFAATDRDKPLELAVCDARRFGTAQLFADQAAVARHLEGRLGLEPFDPGFTPDHLKAALKNRSQAIKAALLDQRLVAGVGNIYADEALFRAGIDPRRPAGRLSHAACERLCEGLREALSAGIVARGASIDSFRHVDGVRGAFQNRFLVHRRAGQPCPRCGAEIAKIRLGGRATYFCPRCQRGGVRRRSTAGRAAR